MLRFLVNGQFNAFVLCLNVWAATSLYYRGTDHPLFIGNVVSAVIQLTIVLINLSKKREKHELYHGNPSLPI